MSVFTTPSSLTLPAPGKVNHFLHIVGRLSNGYHELQTLFQFIDYSDLLTFTPSKNGNIILRALNLSVPEQENLAFKAAKVLQKETGTTQGIHITLHKKLPLGAGLGGGSSDAATTLFALNYLWKTNLSKQQLGQLAVKISADVPIFVAGYSAWGEGIGDKLTKADPEENWLLIIVPDCQVSTKRLFQDPLLTRNSPRLTIEALKVGDVQNCFPLGVRNDFEPLVRSQFSQVSYALDWLSEFGEAKLSGSGSCIFTSFTSKSAAQSVANKLPKSFKGIVTKGINKSPLYEAANKQGIN